MSVPFLVWLAIGLVTVAALLATAIALVRHVSLLSKTLGEFQREVTPAAEELASEASRASDRASRIGGQRRLDLPPE